MKKILFFLCFLCLTPMTASAESIFNDTDSFTLASARKIGRETSKGEASFSTIGKASQSQMAIPCDANCSSCNTATGTCTLCKGSRYLNNNMCVVCPANASCKGTNSFDCSNGYYKSGTSCASCSSAITGCTKCTSGTYCTACSSGYTLKDGKCEEEAAKCTSDNNYYWNANGSKTVPSGYKCIDGYGANASITIPNATDYLSINIRFWNNASVSGTFTTKDLKSTAHTSWYADSLNTVITFNNPVTVTGTVTLQEASTGGKGATMKFNGGLKGSPSCKVERRIETTGCGWASCTDVVSTSTTCKCTSSACTFN